MRQLALTSHRLVCLKQQHKGGNVVIKCEYGLRPSEKEKEKDREKESRRIITGVGKKSDREFVVFTVCDFFLLLLFGPFRDSMHP